MGRTSRRPTRAAAAIDLRRRSPRPHRRRRERAERMMDSRRVGRLPMGNGEGPVPAAATGSPAKRQRPPATEARSSRSRPPGLAKWWPRARQRPPRARGLSPIRDTHSEGFRQFVASMAAPVASGWGVCRVGFTPTGKRRLITAHTQNGPRSVGHVCGDVPAAVARRRA